jgi:hypothetical protein
MRKYATLMRMLSLRGHVEKLLSWLEQFKPSPWTALRIVELTQKEIGAPVLRLSVG